MNLESINWVDVVLGGAVLISALIGIARGLIKEVLSLLAWGVAFWVAWKFADMVAQKYIVGLIDDPTISYLAAFGGLFLVTIFALGLFNMLISSFLASSGLGGIDRMLGMVFGLLRGLLIAAGLVFIGKFIEPVREMSQWQESKFRPTFDAMAEWGIAKLPQEVRQMLDKGGAAATDAGIISSPAAPQVQSAREEQATRPYTTEQAQEQTRRQAENIANIGSPNNPPITLESQQETPVQPPPAQNGAAPVITLESTQGQ